MTLPPIVAAALGPLIAAAVWRAGWLTTAGALAAAALGSACALAGLDWVALLLTFFITSVLLGRLGRAEKQRRSASVIAKAGARDAAQVLANGALFGTAALAVARGTASWPLATVGLGALAAATADTWGTEIGMLSRSAPRSVLTGAPLEPGMSGGPVVDRSGVVTLAGDVGDYFPATVGAADETAGPGAEFQIGRMDPHGRRLIHLRHFGGPVAKYPTALTVQPDRAVTLGGVVQSPGGMSTTPGSFQPSYPGAVTSGFAITVNLLVAGVTPIGEGTPACHGSIVAEGLRSSASGAADFGLYCSGAPENARGALFIGRSSTTPTTFGGAALYIDRAAGFRALRVQTDEFGYLETALPIPALPPGTTFAAQYVFQNHAACQGVGRLSSSNALRLVVQ